MAGEAGLDEVILAAFESVPKAELVQRDLESAGVPAASIRHHVRAPAGESAGASWRGVWASLFGGDADREAPEHGRAYARAIEGGSIVVSVRVRAEHAPLVLGILERHAPIDLREEVLAPEPNVGGRAPPLIRRFDAAGVERGAEAEELPPEAGNEGGGGI